MLVYADVLQVRRIAQSPNLFTVPGTTEAKVWYVYTGTDTSKDVLCVAETRILGNGERLFSAGWTSAPLTRGEEEELLHHTANGSGVENESLHSALDMHGLVGVLEGYSVDAGLGVVDRVHPRLIVGNVLNTLASKVASVSVWNAGLLIELRNGARIEVESGFIDPECPYDVTFGVSTSQSPDEKFSGSLRFGAERLQTFLSEAVYYGRV